MNYRSFNLGDWIGHISGVIEDESTLDGNEMRDLVWFLTTLKQEPCEDCISRQAVLDKLENLDWQELYLPIHFKRILDGLPSVKPKQKMGRWIPVSEGLPKDRREVFVTAYWHETYQVMMGSYYGDGLWWCVPFNNCGEHMQRLKPIAWMPLFLEPYKAESEDVE